MFSSVMQAERKPMAQPVEAYADCKASLSRIVGVHHVGAQLLKHKSGQQVLLCQQAHESRAS